METDVNRSIEEQLSAFLDGELPDEELQLLVRRLEREESFRATLVRYSLIGNILRNDPIQASSEPFRARIMAEITTESEAGDDPHVASGGGFAWARPLAAAAVLTIAIAGLISADLYPGASRADIGLVDSGSQVQRLERRASINQERMTSYLVSHSEWARPFQGPMADSRIFVQQASFEQ
jgi:anti-sigma factor RsiW